jgi:Ni,Fe-hydrogenase III small subunit/ferredoxin
MWRMLLTRLAQGAQTSAFPARAPELPARFRGAPAIDSSRCGTGCDACASSCPTDAIAIDRARVRLDLGRCTFCGACESACPEGVVRFTTDHRLAARAREDLVVSDEGRRLAAALDAKTRALFGRSLKLRQVSAAGCSGCEAELVALGNVVFDLGRFGIQFVASPRHADGVLVTGPVSSNMRLALEKTWAAIPEPRIAIALGACAISGGAFRGGAEVNDGAASIIPIDLYVPGCPPHPFTILDGLLCLLGRLEST